MPNELTVVDENQHGQALALIDPKMSMLEVTVRNMDACMKIAQVVHKSGLAPATLKSPEQVAVALMHGHEIGLQPMNSIQSVYVVNGRPTLWGDSMLGICMVHPDWEWITETFDGSGENFDAICVVKRRDNEPHQTHFSVAMAKKAGLWGKSGPWTTYPSRMLQIRARSLALRDKFPDALRGLACAEEIIDITPVEAEPPVTPKAGMAAERTAKRAAKVVTPEPVEQEQEPEQDHEPEPPELGEDFVDTEPVPEDGPSENFDLAKHPDVIAAVTKCKGAKGRIIVGKAIKTGLTLDELLEQLKEASE